MVDSDQINAPQQIFRIENYFHQFGYVSDFHWIDTETATYA